MQDGMYQKYLKRINANNNIVLRENFTQTELRFKLIDFFRNNTHPSIEEVSEFMDTLQLDEGEFMKLVYDLLSDYARIGNIKNMKDSDFNQEQLKMGIGVEMEHTPEDNIFYRYISKSISKDHLPESDTYYTRLKKMESEFGK